MEGVNPMADPFSLSRQYQDRLDTSGRQFENLRKSVLEGIRIPGIIAKNRIFGVQAQEAQDSLSVSQQLKKAVQDPHGIMGEFGDLKTAAQMRQFMAKHAAISISPIGQKLLGIFDKITTATEEAERDSLERQSGLAQAKKLAEFNAEMIEQGYRPGNPDDESAFRRSRNWRNFRLEATQKLGKDVSGLSVDEDFDSSGRLTPQGEERILSVAPRSQLLQSREEIAADAIASREAMASQLANFRMEVLGIKNAAEMEELKLRLESNIQVQELRNKARLAIAEGQVSREQYLNRHLNETVKQIADSSAGRKMKPEDIHAKALKVLGDSFDQEIQSKRTESAKPAERRIRVRSKSNPALEGWALPRALQSNPDLEEVK